MNKSIEHRLSEEQKAKSWVGNSQENPLSSALCKTVGEPGFRAVSFMTDKGRKLLRINSVARDAVNRISFNGDDVTNENETIHGSGYWETDTNGIAGEINFIAHSIALGKPNQQHG